jgi:hypothetical protein
MNDTVTLRLFDTNRKCRHIEEIPTRRTFSARENKIHWTLKSQKPHRVVFVAHKPTTIAYGLLGAKSLRPDWALTVRIPNLSSQSIQEGCTLTLLLGGDHGDEPIMTFL